MNKVIRSGSEFSGVGAFDYAMKRISSAKGFDHERIFACDWDKYARIVYEANHGRPKEYAKDVKDRKIPEDSLDIFCTSPPCQAFSIAGERLAKEDQRGILFFNSLELIKANNPRFFIFENVKGLLSADDGKTFQEWIILLGGKSVNGQPLFFPHEDSAKYHIYWKVISAKDHGIPQNRDRVFIVGIRDDQDNHFRWPADEFLQYDIHDFIDSQGEECHYLSEKMMNFLLNPSKKNQGQKMEFHSEILESKLKENEFELVVNREGKIDPVPYSLNIDANYHKGIDYHAQRTFIWDGQRFRKFSPRECFRFMDFPEEFDFSMVSNSQAYKMAGNSIVVRVLEKIINNLKL
jgi:DNA (cytosine-5)-methyltransferase 1